jgi:soluble lytic murein transglycosylase-like protein
MAIATAVLTWSSIAVAGPVDRWSAPIAEASRRFGVPEQWIRRVIRIESGGRAMVRGAPIVSSAGAMGLMQLMPATWRDMRALLKLGPDPNDPRNNIMAGTAYLRLMYDRFGYPGMFAAYNAGPARYADHLASGVNLPAETRAYVARAAGVARDPSPAAPISGRHAPALFAVAPAEDVSPPSRAAAINMFGSLFVDLRGTAGR